MITPAYICDAIRTPFCREGGKLSALPADDLAALPLLALIERYPGMDWEQVGDVILGCAYQSGDEAGDVARTASLLADLPAAVPGVTLNRQCGSGLDAVGAAARAIKSGEIGMAIAGGIESSRRHASLFNAGDGVFHSRHAGAVEGHDDRSWLLPLVRHQIGSDLDIETAEHIARESHIDRHAQDHFAWASYRKAAAARKASYTTAEIAPVTIAGGDPIIVSEDEAISPLSLQALADMEAFLPEGTVTAGNAASGGDGACALLLACEKAALKHSLLPRARILGMATAGVVPQLSGIGAAGAARKLLVQTGLNLDQMDVIELHEAFAAHALAVLRDWGLRDDDPRINPNGGAIALGDPIGASGARLVVAAVHQLHRIKGRYALCAMCGGAGQGIALVIERV